MKDLYIAEKPSVAAEFAKALGVNAKRQNGYMEDDKHVVTWCVGHLVTMSYPEKYDIKYKRWSLDTLPFLPTTWLYEVIDGVKAQFETVSKLLNRDDVNCIYICTDSGREGEYIYRLVDMMAGVHDKERKRVWIDSQTEEEILRGIREAKDWSFYDNLSSSAYLRAKEDYLMGINFSRVLSLKYGNSLANLMNEKYSSVNVGRVMTCVLGMVVNREREIRDFVKTPFYRVIGVLSKDGFNFDSEWKTTEESEFYESPKLYKDNGFKEKETASNMIKKLEAGSGEGLVHAIEKKKEVRNAPLLYNLAEIQNDCSKKFKISPDETLTIIQELYEKKLVTYPRTDARVLSTAVAKEIDKNIRGLVKLDHVGEFATAVLGGTSYKSIGKTRYTNDSQITDHYAIIPTGQGLNNLKSLNSLSASVYELICRRFLSIFYPPATYEKYTLDISVNSDTHKEHFFTSFKLCKDEGFLAVSQVKKEETESGSEDMTEGHMDDPKFMAMINSIKKNDTIGIGSYSIKEGETSPPKRYSSGSMILAMENAGQLIEDEELRSHIKGSGIGTSATRAEILKKLCSINYMAINKKTQILTPTLKGEMVYEIVTSSMKQLLNPELTASWEKGLTYVAEGNISDKEYMEKLEHFVSVRVNSVRNISNQYILKNAYNTISKYYNTSKVTRSKK